MGEFGCGGGGERGLGNRYVRSVKFRFDVKVSSRRSIMRFSQAHEDVRKSETCTVQIFRLIWHYAGYSTLPVVYALSFFLLRLRLRQPPADWIVLLSDFSLVRTSPVLLQVFSSTALL